MRSRMKEHSEETNELFNLMARQIKQRCEERINLFLVDDLEKGDMDSADLLNRQQEMQDEIDRYLMNNNFEEADVVAMGGDRSDVEVLGMSAGHSPTKTAEIKSTSKMHQMLET